MSRMGTAVLAFIGLTAIAFMLVGCNGFFVSPNSLASFAVNPPAAVLTSGASSALTLSANGLNVNNVSTSVSPNWTSSDTSCTSISFSSSGCTFTTTGASVTVTTMAAGAATITASASGATSQTVSISVITGAISGITATISPTTVSSSGGQTSEAVAASNGPIQCQYVNWGTPPSGTSFTCTNNNNSLTITVSSAASTATGLTGGQVTIPEPSVTTNGNQLLTPTSFSGTLTII